jgi:N-acetylneuraminic acid mutarotase
MKTKNKISGHIIRSGAVALSFSFALIALSSAFNLPNRSASSSWPVGLTGTAVRPAKQSKTLTFAERVAYQRSIEEVYWRHRIWPKERPDPKPSLDKVMSQVQIQKKVEDYLRNSQLLADYWQRSITPEQLQAEMDRMASQTKQPEVLREIFAALGDDPFVIAECLARPALAERLVTDLYAHDQRFHGELKRRAEAELAGHLPAVASAKAGHVLEQMKQMSGAYSEVEWIRSGDDKQTVGQARRLPNPELAGEPPALQIQGAGDAIRMDDSEWTDNVQRLAVTFDEPSAPIPVGRLSSLQEAEGAYYATEVISKGKDRLKLATIAWMKQPFNSWRAKAETQIPATMAVTTGIEYSLPVISDASTTGTNDTWTATSTINAPSARAGHTAVWTGNEMIVWGGVDFDGIHLNTGGRYNPTTDSWTATSTTNAPSARTGHTAVWTGSEMIVWSGHDRFYLNTGGRYNLSTNSWTATSTTNAPSPRWGHTAVWTGSEMIVWGGDNSNQRQILNTGGRYNPSTDSWTATSTTNARARTNHTAVWTGGEMIVWSGDSTSGITNSGGRYNPSTDSWTATSTTNAPSARVAHTGVWTGSEMIVWGGFGNHPPFYLNTGGRYNPTTDTWTATSTTNAPSPRAVHTAVRAGSEMIVWGGEYSDANFNYLYLNTGGRYNPGTNSWIATSTTNAPSGRRDQKAVWTGSGSEMIVWGGYNAFTGDLSTGGRYYALGPPAVTTNPASYIASYSATLNGTVNPRGFPTTVYFQYGTTTSYGHTTASQSYSGTTTRSVTANISGLSASTTYHFRIVATNSVGIAYGPDRTFTTLSASGPPVVTTNPATLIASFSARLNGSVDPHGLTTTVYFEYGTTTSYGLTTAPQGKTGNTYQNVAATISGLTANTTYHFRIVATNGVGTRYGADRTFRTLGATGPPVVITHRATNVASSSATLNGLVDPHGLMSSVYFQYGTTTSYGQTTPSQSKNGNTYQNVAANISGLSASTTYHFRIVATNSAGTRYGADRVFTTP